MGMMSGAMSMLGGLVQAQGAMQQAEAEAKAHDYNAAVAKRNEGTIHEQTFAGIVDQLRARSREIHGIRAKFAANGITQSGSSLDVIYDTVHEEALGIQRIRYAGRLAEIEQIDTYNLETMAASASRQAGKISATAAIIGGLSGAVSAMN